MTFRQLYASSGKPCSSSTQGRSGLPASRQCIDSPFTRSTRRERIPEGRTLGKRHREERERALPGLLGELAVVLEHLEALLVRGLVGERVLRVVAMEFEL